ncbi:hypothetical protein [Aureimonas frigidaquae]|uniref:hypothetical protein n=1 Tax=Aureimonas frigidaquae TaxID=424757 RepID=UPI000AA6E7C9|nr:hypothetical protein [Aureimonas frigidaquae]
MKRLILAGALGAAITLPALAQDAATAPQAATPTCAQALPQIDDLVGQAESSGLQTADAKTHVGEAQAAQSRNDEEGCIRALVLAQNTILDQVRDQQPPS